MKAMRGKLVRKDDGQPSVAPPHPILDLALLHLLLLQSKRLTGGFNVEDISWMSELKTGEY
ncbi:unnamed protein product [Rodentolepis nana]|uniref:Uncharacterized protein n=1 Tax=Rodentolepis nana TaxID=102285 RepID=A0A0R3THE5_RODNA|nr:unnamed protein product [Rodentolepis nana]